MNPWVAAVGMAMAGLITGFAAAWVREWYNREKTAAETEHFEVESVTALSDQAVNLTIKVIELGERVNKVSAVNTELGEKLRYLEQSNERLSAEVHSLRATNERLVTEIHALRDQITDLGHEPRLL